MSHKSTSSESSVALVCDWLTTPGGAEKVLLELHKMYPNAPIYTSQYRPGKINWFKDTRVITGWLNFFPASLRKFLGPLRQLFFSHLDLSRYDLVISVTGAEAKAVKTKSATHEAVHLCYCHVPTQYYWGKYDSYLKNPGFGFFNPIVRLFLKLLVGPLRKADLAAASRVSHFLTISSDSAAQIKRYYRRSSTIIYPPVEVAKFTTSAKFSSKEAADYFVISCRQVAWKRVDLAISACLACKEKLVVIGDGPEYRRLVKLADGSDLITFVSWLDTPALAAYLQQARAYLFPSHEPFGIAAVEALAAGCPVIAYVEGGSRDFIQDGKNGLTFSRQATASLAAAIKDFPSHRWNRVKIASSAARFSAEAFRSGIKQVVKERTDKAHQHD